MAKKMIDISLDTGFDVAITNGDFSLEESTAQHQQQLIVNNKGDFKQDPAMCVGAVNYFDDEHFYGLIRAVSIAFSRDGMDVKSIKLSQSGMINSDAFYQ